MSTPLGEPTGEMIHAHAFPGCKARLAGTAQLQSPTDPPLCPLPLVSLTQGWGHTHQGDEEAFDLHGGVPAPGG